MPDSQEINDPDFDAQLRGLFEEAEQQALERRTPNHSKGETAPESPEEEDAGSPRAESRPADEKAAKTGRTKGNYPNLPQMLRPLVLGLEAMTRATGENTSLLTKLDRAADANAEAQTGLPQLISELRTLLELKNGINQRMFDALHEELKGYKDDFLLESVHRPVIRDLITLYDDFSEVHREIKAAVEVAATASAEGSLRDRLKVIEVSVGHKLEFIVEVLARLEVTPLPHGGGKLDKHTQRAMALEAAGRPDEDNDVVRSIRRGFLWKARVVRAEEVVVKRWKDGVSPPMESPS